MQGCSHFFTETDVMKKEVAYGLSLQPVSDSNMYPTGAVSVMGRSDFLRIIREDNNVKLRKLK